MNKAKFRMTVALLLCAVMLFACSGQSANAAKTAEDGEAFVFPEGETDFASLRTPGSQEAAYNYQSFFLPAEDNGVQPYVGDTMPYYENGTYYIYYLNEGGDSYNHSIYLTTTQDFVTYTEQDAVVLEASRSGGQDGWIGTGSVVKVKDVYYFFYTGHAGSDSYEYKEKIMVAKSSDLTSFEKVEGWEIVPPNDLGQKNDFRDPQGYYDAETDTITLTVTASQSNKARVIKYTLSGDLETVKVSVWIETHQGSHTAINGGGEPCKCYCSIYRINIFAAFDAVFDKKNPYGHLYSRMKDTVLLCGCMLLQQSGIITGLSFSIHSIKTDVE